MADRAASEALTAYVEANGGVFKLSWWSQFKIYIVWVLAIALVLTLIGGGGYHMRKRKRQGGACPLQQQQPDGAEAGAGAGAEAAAATESLSGRPSFRARMMAAMKRL